MIEICYCGNRRIFPQVLLSVLSIVKHTAAPVRVHLFTMDLSDVDGKFLPFSEEQRQILEDVVRAANEQSCVRIVDAGSYCMVVEIVHPSYEYAEEFTTEESRTFFITVQ